MMEGDKYLAEDDEELEKEVEEIVKWSKELDFDSYADEWFFKSTIFTNLDS